MGIAFPSKDGVAQAHKLDALDFFKGFAVQADELPDAVFTAIGRTVWQDIGPTAVIMRLVMKVGIVPDPVRGRFLLLTLTGHLRAWIRYRASAQCTRTLSEHLLVAPQVMDYNLLATLVARIAYMLPDFKRQLKAA